MATDKKRSFLYELTHPERKIVLRTRGEFDMKFLIYVVLLVCFGSIMIFSAGHVYAQKYLGDSFYFVKRQFIFALLGIAVMILLSNIDYALFKRYALPIFIVSYILLILVLIPGIGVSLKGARRWIKIGPLQFQPPLIHLRYICILDVNL